VRLVPTHVLVMIVSLSLLGCASPRDLAARKPGDVVSDTIRGRKQGYVERARSIVNPANHSEGVGHFTFVYFKKFEVCQCGLSEVVISPRGRYVVFVASAGVLSVFDSRLLKITQLSEGYVGYPKSVEWNFSGVPLTVSLVEPNAANTVRRASFDINLEPET